MDWGARWIGERALGSRERGAGTRKVVAEDKLREEALELQQLLLGRRAPEPPPQRGQAHTRLLRPRFRLPLPAILPLLLLLLVAAPHLLLRRQAPMVLIASRRPVQPGRVLPLAGTGSFVVV
eukprot:3938939-Rhodomonas_salina.2